MAEETRQRPEDEGGELSWHEVRRYLEAPRRRPLTVLVPWAGVFLLAIAALFVLPKRYQSTTLILVESEKVPESFVPRVATEDRIANIVDNGITQELLVRAGHNTGCVPGGNNRKNSGKLFSAGCVNGKYFAPGDVAANDFTVQHARQHDVIGKLRSAGCFERGIELGLPFSYYAVLFVFSGHCADSSACNMFGETLTQMYSFGYLYMIYFKTLKVIIADLTNILCRHYVLHY